MTPRHPRGFITRARLTALLMVASVVTSCGSNKAKPTEAGPGGMTGAGGTTGPGGAVGGTQGGDDGGTGGMAGALAGTGGGGGTTLGSAGGTTGGAGTGGSAGSVGGSLTWTLRSPSASPSPRLSVGMAYDSVRGVAVMFGGLDSPGRLGGDVRLSETWEWDGNNWTRRTPATIPPARNAMGTAFDSSRGRTVIFGGTSGSAYLGDTWEWDGKDWKLCSPATAPSARTMPAMAYDGTRRRVVLFGGATSSAYSSQTWEWDGSNWTLRAPATSPPARVTSAMSFDADRGVIVMFGGYDGKTSLGDTWEWDGNDWRQRLPATSPLPRDSVPMIYDGARRVTVLFGGLDSGTAYGETWEWDGNDWKRQLPATSPSRRSDHGMAYDSLRRKAVSFGGLDTAQRGDTWEYPDACPAGGCPSACTPATKRCDDIFAQTCDAAGHWQYEPVCALRCTDGVCESIVVGTWTGTTSQSLPIEFDVSPSGMAITRFDYSWASTECGRTGSNTITGQAAIARGSFSVSEGFCPSAKVSGSFSSPTSASGQLSLGFVNAIGCSCTDSLVVLDWKASAP